jgi:arginase family enzyme
MKGDYAPIVDALTEDVYITVDLDCFDPATVPGVGTPEPGGLDWYELTEVVAQVARKSGSSASTSWSSCRSAGTSARTSWRRA